VNAYLVLDTVRSPSDEAARQRTCHVVVVASHRPGVLLFVPLPAADVAFLRRSAVVQACRGGCRWSGCGDDGQRCGWALWMVVVVVEEEEGLLFVDAQIEHRQTPMPDLGGGHGIQNISRSFYCLLMVIWYSCKSVLSFVHVICCGGESSILRCNTIFDNKYHGIFHMEFHQNSMESRVDMCQFHMESSGIHMEWCWNPYGISHSITIPWSFHMESIMSME